MKIKHSLIALAAILSITSCKKDFLNTPVSDAIAVQIYVKDLKTANDYLNGIYGMLQGYYDGYNTIYPDLIADDLKPRTANLLIKYNWGQFADIPSVTNSNNNNSWSGGYRTIRACSYIINKVGEYREKDPATADNMKAQAYALRALMHFYMVNTFAQSYNFSADGSHMGIPYITTDDWTQPVIRQTVAQVYEGMIADLNNSLELFPATSASTLYFNRNAANALLARIYLYKGDYANAKNIARRVITAKPIMTGSNYPGKLFTLQETEALFQIAPSWTGVAGGTFNLFPSGVYYSNLYQFNATADIANILKENPQDVRSSWVTLQSTGAWNVTKFPSGIVSGFPAPGLSYYQTPFRSSEMYLTAAESYAKLGSDSAIYYLDALRLRANPSAAITTATGAALLDSIYKERRKELSFESFRMFDLLRWKKPVNRADFTLGSPQSLPYPSDKAISPIPINDVKIAGLQQNPSY